MSFIDKAKDVAVDIKDKAEDLSHKVGEKVPDSVKETAHDLKEKAGDLFDKAKDKLGIGDEKPDMAVATDEASDATL